MSPDRSDARARAAAWLRMNFPHHASKVLQSTFGLEERTAKRVLAGQASQFTLERMRRKFGRSFAEFVFVDGLAPAAMTPTRALWFTPAAVHEAVGGHQVFARDLMGLPADTETDCAAYMRVNQGWVSAVLTPGRLEAVTHGAGNAAALERLRDWLVPRASLVREVVIDGRVADTLAAIVDLDRRAAGERARDAALSLGWRVEELALDGIEAPHLNRFYAARLEAGRAPGTLPRLLQRTGVLPYAALFHHHPDRTTRTLIVGEKLGVDPVEAIGRELSERRERLYADNLRRRLEGALVGPTLHRLRLPVNGRLWDYDSLADFDAPAADGSRIGATIVDIRGSEKVAA